MGELEVSKILIDEKDCCQTPRQVWVFEGAGLYYNYGKYIIRNTHVSDNIIKGSRSLSFDQLARRFVVVTEGEIGWKKEDLSKTRVDGLCPPSWIVLEVPPTAGPIFVQTLQTKLLYSDLLVNRC